jgi:cysteine desulfurase
LIYLDNNATTRVLPEVLDAMLPWFGEDFGNASSLHFLGQRAADAVAAARSSVARLVGAASPREIVFTSGATESNQSAIHAALAARPAARRVVTTAVEHAAVLEPLEALAGRGLEVVRVGVDAQGRLDHDALEAALGPGCALVSVMWANNETGAVHDVARIGAACRTDGIPFHVDAVQAAGKLPLALASLPVDMASFSAHKLHGPKGVGCLYVRRGFPFEAWQKGGGQEDERRAGTENVPGIVGFGRAAELARQALERGALAEVARLRDRLEQGLCTALSGVRVHASGLPRVPNTTNLRFEGISGEALVALLSEAGICAATGSACSSGRQAPSHVLLAMGLSPAEASGSLRLSLSRETTPAEIDTTLGVLPGLVAQLRALAGEIRHSVP